MATVLVASTDKKPERIETLSITRRPGEIKQVVMSLGPGDLPYSATTSERSCGFG